MSPATPPLPRPSALTQPFWDAANESRLLLQVDPVSGRHQFFPRPCSLYGPQAPQWVEAGGGATLVAVTLSAAAAPGFDEPAGCLMAIVRLDEGPRLLAQIVNAAFDDLKVGQRLRLSWDRRRPTQQVYCFEPWH